MRAGSSVDRRVAARQAGHQEETGTRACRPATIMVGIVAQVTTAATYAVRAGAVRADSLARVRVTVIGCGYLGAVHAACMADFGHDVVGIDVDEAKIEALAAGRPPFFEPGLPELLTRTVATGRLRFTWDVSEAGRPAGDAGTGGPVVHFVCVGTPQRRGEMAADTSYVDAAVQSLLPHLRPGDLVVGKSTVPVGTAAAPRGPHHRPGAGRAAGLEPRVPARGARRRRHAAAGPPRLRPAARPRRTPRPRRRSSTRSTPTRWPPVCR